MIFKKDANFPYPVLANNIYDYEESYFNFEVNLFEEKDRYIFDIEYDLSSYFISDLLSTGKAKIYLVIKSQDVTFMELKEKKVCIDKNRISLSKRSEFQLFIAASKRLSMKDNNELDEYFEKKKHGLFLNPGNLLAYSNVERFDGDMKHPFKLFNYQVNDKLETDIEISLKGEFIYITYRDNDYRYQDEYNYIQLNYHYIYMGLQKALMKMLLDHQSEELILDDLDETEDLLQIKLINLMTTKGVKVISFDNIDLVIEKISDKIIDKHTIAVKGLKENG